LALILANVPLFNILAFEFCGVLALGISFAGAHVPLTAVQQMKRHPDALRGSPRQIVIRCFWNALIFNFGLLVLPVGIILLNALRIKNCNFSEGFIFFFLLSVISCVYATAAGTLFGFWIKRRWLAYLAYLGFLLLTCVPVVINLIFHPPVFAYHATFGYFPGPIYDFVIKITDTLLIARAETLLWALLFLGLAVSLCEISRDTALMPQLRWRKLFSSLTKRVWLYLLIACLLGFQVYAGALGIRPTRDNIARKLGGFRETEHFEIFYARELETEIENIVEDCEFQYAQLSVYLTPEGAELSRKVRAYIYASPGQKKQLIGAGSTSVEDPFGHGFHIHAQGFPHPVLKHELAHVFTVPWSPLKVSLKIGLHEGIAVAADWDEGKLTAHQWAKAMREMEIAPPLSAIMGIGFWGHAGSRSYLLAGSFVRFLVDTYGIEKFKGVFPTGNFVKHYGKELQLLETEWIHFLEGVPLRDTDINYTAYRLKQRSAFEQVCTHEMAALRDTAWQAYYRKDFVTAVETFGTMLSDEPDSLSTLRGLMYSAYRMQDYEKALSLANRIASVEDTRFSPEALLLIGDIYWLKNEHEKAMGAYVSIETEYETFERLRMKRIAALSYPDSVQSQPNGEMREERSLRELLRDVLVASKPVSEKMALLSVCIQTAPESWLPYLLTGELLQKEKAWQISNAYLHQAVERLIPQQHGKLILEIRRLIGINAYQQKDYETAQKAFRSIAETTILPLGETLSAQNWIQRCQWAESRIP
jgi:tetratricopeptide (TPR) repeat protein